MYMVTIVSKFDCFIDTALSIEECFFLMQLRNCAFTFVIPRLYAIIVPNLTIIKAANYVMLTKVRNQCVHVSYPTIYFPALPKLLL